MDPVKLSEVLRLTHKDIQDHDDRRGKTYPLKLRVKKTLKTIKKRYKSTNMQDQDGESVTVDGTDEDDDDEDVLVQDVEDEEGDEVDDDEAEADGTCDVNEQDVETDSDNMSVDTEVAECHFTTIKEAFMAGWKAKQKTNAKRKARGFTDPSKAPGGGKKQLFKKKNG